MTDIQQFPQGAPERKRAQLPHPVQLTDGARIEGYASLFGQPDQGGDLVQRGAYAKSLQALARDGRRVKMLWQHDPAQPIGIWDAAFEDARGLYVKGRLLDGVAKAEEARALIEAGAIDGLSIGYRTLRAERDAKSRRVLTEVELWEVSLVTFPMLPTARLTQQKQAGADAHGLRRLARHFTRATRDLAATSPRQFHHDPTQERRP